MRKLHKIFKALEPLFRFIEVIAIVAGVAITLIQLNDLKIQKSADLAIKFNDTLDHDYYAKILETIDSRNPLMKENNPSGRFSQSDVEGYLGIYETIANLYEKNLISREMIEANFSYDIAKAYRNDEIKNLIRVEQKIDPDLWVGFQKLGQMFSNKHP